MQCINCANCRLRRGRAHTAKCWLQTGNRCIEIAFLCFSQGDLLLFKSVWVPGGEALLEKQLSSFVTLDPLGRVFRRTAVIKPLGRNFKKNLSPVEVSNTHPHPTPETQHTCTLRLTNTNRDFFFLITCPKPLHCWE